MREFDLPGVSALHVEVAVSVDSNRSVPLPTSVASFELAKESLRHVSGTPLVRHGDEYTTGYTLHVGQQLLAHVEERAA